MKQTRRHWFVNFLNSRKSKDPFWEPELYDTHTVTPPKPKVKVYITNKAYQKIKALVEYCDTEIAWHGVMHKTAIGFMITDIIVPPQQVTGCTTTSDDLEYSTWLFNLPDEIFKHLRFHGHSHVNMGVSPSATDLTYRKNLTNNIGDNFYLFMIANKKDNMSFALYENGTQNTNIKLIILNNYKDWAFQEIKNKLTKRSIAYDTEMLYTGKELDFLNELK